jgi:hypothetical protein
MVSFALIWTICLRYLAATKRSSPVPLPGFIQSFLASLPAKLLCLDPRPVSAGAAAGQSNGVPADGNDAGTGGGGGADMGKFAGSTNPYREDWAWLAHLLDRIAFLVYLIIYLCFYLALL